MQQATIRKPQRFPVYYPGEAQFLRDGQPSGARGAEAVATIELNTAPHEFVGLRVTNDYPSPLVANLDDAEDIARLDALTRILLAADQRQDITIELAQQNLVVRRVFQAALTGGDSRTGTVFLPFPCPFPFRGGNSITIRAVRTQDYPVVATDAEVAVIFPTLKCGLVGWVYREGQFEPGNPPVSGFDG
jgi:hypothetical protein